MRRFSSYGPVSKESHYYVPRTELVRQARESLLGENPAEGGHYITVWASCQSGKSWLLRELSWGLANDPAWLVANIDVQNLLRSTNTVLCMNEILNAISLVTGLSFPHIDDPVEFQRAFSRHCLDRPLILISMNCKNK